VKILRESKINFRAFNKWISKVDPSLTILFTFHGEPPDPLLPDIPDLHPRDREWAWRSISPGTNLFSPGVGDESHII
jgi:hypothetical protein